MNGGGRQGNFRLVWRRWGKSERDGGPGFHLLPYHCLDVAAVLAAGFESNPGLLRELERLLEMPQESMRPMLLTLLSVHDVGKCGRAFQKQRDDIARRLGLNVEGVNRYDADRFGHAFAGQAMLQRLLEEDRWSVPLNAGAMDFDELATLLAVATGHHGRQPGIVSNYFAEFTAARQCLRSDLHAAEELARALCVLHKWHEGLPSREAVARASYALNGLFTLCDWLGSSEAFEFIDHKLADDTAVCLDLYWHTHALEKARKVIDELRPTKLWAVERTTAVAFRTMFAHLDRRRTVEPTLLQAACERLFAPERIPAGPILVFIEDATGSGKTEAGDVIVQRLLAAGRADGVYFALPTMATADGAFARKLPAAKHLLVGRPSLVLAHSRKDRSKAFKRVHTRAEFEQGDAAALDWFAKGSKRALLADLGVGTVDQALIGALRAKHNTVRLWGLHRKVLLVDEVHAYDDYMRVALCALLRYHARLGNSAILMSATLPSGQRAELVRAYAEGAGWGDVEEQAAELDRKGYPLLSVFSRDDMVQERVDPEADRPTARPIRFAAAHRVDEVHRRVLAWLAAGRCAIWFRNTVDDAVDAFEALCPEIVARGWPEPILYHARFVPKHRARIERCVQTLFGKRGRWRQRCSRLVIATQVAEQSLDLDFDEAVIDLAPADVVLQRAGRRRRHRRDADGRPIWAGDDGRPASEVALLLPPFEAVEAGWYARLFWRAANIYDDDARLWLGARHLLDPTTIPDRRSPKGPLIPDLDVRALLESVYAAEDDVRRRTPQALHRRMDEAAGADRAEARLGHLNTLSFRDGLLRDWNRGNPVLGEDESAPTRLGENHAVVLVEREGQEVRFLVMGDDPLQDSLCPCPQRLRNAPADEALRERLQGSLRTPAQRRRFRWHDFVVLERTGHDTWRGMAMSDANERIAVTYDACRGLRLQRG